MRPPDTTDRHPHRNRPRPDRDLDRRIATLAVPVLGSIAEQGRVVPSRCLSAQGLDLGFGPGSLGEQLGVAFPDPDPDPDPDRIRIRTR